MKVDGEAVESWLPEIFEVVAGSGRRITAVPSLRVEDIDLEGTRAARHGAVVWSEGFGKLGKRWRCPISAKVRDVRRSGRRRLAVPSAAQPAGAGTVRADEPLAAASGEAGGA